MVQKIINNVKKLGFTDRFGVWTSIVVGIFVFCCLGVFTFTDKDPIAYVISAVGFLGTLVGFIINKNKAENQTKITLSAQSNQSDNTVV